MRQHERHRVGHAADRSNHAEDARQYPVGNGVGRRAVGLDAPPLATPTSAGSAADCGTGIRLVPQAGISRGPLESNSHLGLELDDALALFPRPPCTETIHSGANDEASQRTVSPIDQMRTPKMLLDSPFLKEQVLLAEALAQDARLSIKLTFKSGLFRAPRYLVPKPVERRESACVPLSNRRPRHAAKSVVASCVSNRLSRPVVP